VDPFYAWLKSNAHIFDMQDTAAEAFQAGTFRPLDDVIEAEFTVREALSELADSLMIPAELLPPERETSGYDPRGLLRE
jgi:hypothetical protein